MLPDDVSALIASTVPEGRDLAPYHTSLHPSSLPATKPVSYRAYQSASMPRNCPQQAVSCESTKAYVLQSTEAPALADDVSALIASTVPEGGQIFRVADFS